MKIRHYFFILLALGLAFSCRFVLAEGGVVSITANVPGCGNGIIEGAEQCDGAALGSQTCISRGFSGGQLSCAVNCTFNTSQCTTGSTGGSSGGSSGGSGYVPPTTGSVSFSGRAYPNSEVTVLKDAQVAATTIAGTNANFQVNVVGLSGGNYIFSLYSEDNTGDRSALLTFPVSVTSGATVNVTGIFIAPTIGVDKSQVKRGEDIAIFGQSLPEADVTIAVSSEDEHFSQVVADDDGIYLLNFDTAVLEMGQHYTKSKAANGGSVSSYGRTISFAVGNTTIFNEGEQTIRGDINGDGKVNLVDFSILAYWYKRSSPPANIDLNGDNKVDLIDFSILAFYWTG